MDFSPSHPCCWRSRGSMFIDRWWTIFDCSITGSLSFIHTRPVDWRSDFFANRSIQFPITCSLESAQLRNKASCSTWLIQFREYDTGFRRIPWRIFIGLETFLLCQRFPSVLPSLLAFEFNPLSIRYLLITLRSCCNLFNETRWIRMCLSF